MIKTDIDLWNADIAPTTAAQRTLRARHFLALWIGMVMAVPGYMLVAGLIDQGMSAGQAVGVVLLGNLIVLIPMVLIGHAGAKYGVPYAVLGRASWPWPGRWSPAVGTASRHGSAAGRCSHFLASRSAIGWRARQYRCWA